MAPMIEEKIEQTSPMMLKMRPVILSEVLYSLIPRTIPMIETMCPTRAKSHANTMPMIPRITEADACFCDGFFLCAVDFWFTMQPQPGQITAPSLISFPHTEQYTISSTFLRYLLGTYWFSISRNARSFSSTYPLTPRR